MDVPLAKVEKMVEVYLECLALEPDIEHMFYALGYDVAAECALGRLVLNRIRDKMANGEEVL